MRIALLLLVVIGCSSPSEPMTTIVSDGMATWWNRPLWTERDGFLYGEVVQSDGDVLAVKVDLADLSVTTSTLGTHEEDDHNAGGHVVPSDQPPIFFWARHNLDTSLRYRVGSGAAGELTFGSAQTITFAGNVTYSQAWRGTGNEVHVFVRDASRYWSNVYSSGWGTGWSTPRRIIDFGAAGLYYIATQPTEADPTILRLAAYGHPSSSSIHDIRVGLIDLDSGDITQLDGTVVGNLKDGTDLPVSYTDLDLAWDSPTDHSTRMYDVGDGASFRIAFSDWDTTTDTSSTYKLMTYNGSSWVTEDIVASGDAFYDDGDRRYYGGMALPDRDDGTLLYTSRQAGGTWYIEKWTKDGTWSAETIASDSAMLVRPWTPERPSSVRVLWHRATAYADIDFTASLEAVRSQRPVSVLAGRPSAWPSFRP